MPTEDSSEDSAKDDFSEENVFASPNNLDINQLFPTRFPRIPLITLNTNDSNISEREIIFITFTLPTTQRYQLLSKKLLILTN